MITDKTVIISCAGMGKRLGRGIPKALVEVEGKTLLTRTLELLDDVEDIRIVVGYQAEKVIQEALKYRKDITFVFNRDYENTGTGASVTRASLYAKEFILTIDGDIIVHPDDMRTILNMRKEFVGGCAISSDDPVYIQTASDNVIAFSREKGEYEWTGITLLRSARVAPTNGHVYGIVEPLLPLPYKIVRLKEIDTENDYQVASKWVRNNYSEDLIIGVIGGMGSYATADFFSRLIEAFPATKEWERPRIIVDNYSTMPSRVRAILYNEKCQELIDDLTKSVENLIRSGANKIILACNTSHVFLPEIFTKVPDSKKYIINIIDECAKRLRNIRCGHLHLMASEGTIQSNIYETTFNTYDIEIGYPTKNQLTQIRNFIEAVKTNNVSKSILLQFSDYINNSASDAIILGCTELPIIYKKCIENDIELKKTIVDPLECAIDAVANTRGV